MNEIADEFSLLHIFECSFDNFHCGIHASFQSALLLFSCLFSIEMSIIVVALIFVVAVVQGVNLSVLFAECLQFSTPSQCKYDEWIIWMIRYVQSSVEQQQAAIAYNDERMHETLLILHTNNFSFFVFRCKIDFLFLFLFYDEITARIFEWKFRMTNFNLMMNCVPKSLE